MELSARTSLLTSVWNRISGKLQTKLLLLFSGISIVAVQLVCILSFYQAKEALLHRTFEQLNAAQEAKRANLEELLHNKLDGAELAASSVALDHIMLELVKQPNLEVDNKAVNVFLEGGDYHSMMVIFDTAHIAYGHFSDRIRFTDQMTSEMREHLKNVYSSVSRSKTSTAFDYINFQDSLLLTIASPAYFENGTVRAVVALTIRLESIDQIMLNQKNQGIGNSGETYLVGNDRYLRSSSRFEESSVLKVQVNSEAVEKALMGLQNTVITKDYRGISVLSSYSPVNVPGLKWAILAEIDEEEILAPVHKLELQIQLLSGIVLIVLIVVIMWTSRELTRPLVKLRELASEIAMGQFGKTIPVTTMDEVGQLTHAINEMSVQIHSQREELKEKNQEILDSITYAKRIQTGLLPSNRLIESLLQESFVLYVPKHIVSGDFYYAGNQNGHIIFGVGDCTGHGVPGALVSGICMSALQRTIKAFGKTRPSEILDMLNEIVTGMFSESDIDIHDGMDIAICSIDHQGKTLQYAGANNPMFYIRNGELNELKADRQPIGKFSSGKPFANQELAIQEGDCIYLFSDGYVDQFGGPNEKKFRYSRFRQLLLEIHQKPMAAQKFILEEALNNWKGDQDQIDDICIFGARL